ncbi:MAG: GyrI-like domain-containing protein [Eubacteriaceae bacterium]|nr:GyrI-like domain-containing protein [Eubacteriaceae bacterium]
MAKVNVSFEARQFEPMRFIGKKTIVEKEKTATKFVKAFREGGDLDFLMQLEGRITPDGDFAIWMGDYDSVTASFTEIVGVFAEANCPVPEGWDHKDMPGCTLGICSIEGPTRSLSSGAHNKAVKQMKLSGYEADYSYGFSMEYYSHEKYAIGIEGAENPYTFVYLLPCTKAKEQ